MRFHHLVSRGLLPLGLLICALPARGAEVTAAELEALRQQLHQLEERLSAAEAPPPAAAPVAAAVNGSNALRWEGYVSAIYENYDFFRNAQDDNPDRRSRTDLERVVLEAEKSFGNGFSFETEIEIEHGGSGSAVEFEPEEFGEFEPEIEQGGEVTVEYAYLQYQRNNWGLRLGHLLVPVGMANTDHQPTDYFTLRRSLGETALIPNVWHETGAEWFGAWNNLRWRALLVTGLDSSGFGSTGWVAGGSKRRLESVNADSLALVLRADWYGIEDLLLGASIYSGDSADNRPLQNMTVSANVTVAETHARYEHGPWKLRGQYLRGWLENADAVTNANLQAFNPDALGVSRTPVGSQAYAWYAEAGYDLFSLWPQREFGRLDGFVRYDAYDTMAAVAGTVADNPRFDRSAASFGLNYLPHPNIVFKGEYSQRKHEGTVGKHTDIFGLGLGFEF